MYDAFYKGGEVVEVGCWAHARRYFIEAEDGEPALAKEAISRIGELYAIERQAKEAELSPYPFGEPHLPRERVTADDLAHDERESFESDRSALAVLDRGAGAQRRERGAVRGEAWAGCRDALLVAQSASPA